MSSDRQILSAAIKIRKIEIEIDQTNPAKVKNQQASQAIDELKFLLSPKNALKSIDVEQ